MATNAAKELLALVDEWNVEGKSVVSARHGTDPARRPLYEAMNRAVRLLTEVEAFIASREDAGEYSEFVQAIRSFVYAPGVNWNSHAITLDSGTRLHLKMVGELMTHSPLATVALTPEQITALRSAVDDCLDILETDTGQVQEAAGYLRYLLRRSLDILDGEDVDLLALRDLSFQITGVGSVVAKFGIPDDSRERFAESLGGIVLPFTLQATAAAAGNLLSAGGLWLLGG